MASRGREGQTGALDELRGLPIVSLASGDETGMALQVPYRGTDALIQLDTREAHPGFGWGLLVRCLLPGGPGPGPGWANLRNRQELASLTRAHFLGSWVGSAAFATFVAFYPNLVAGSGMSVQNIALSTINRVRWLATFGRDGT